MPGVFQKQKLGAAVIVSWPFLSLLNVAIDFFLDSEISVLLMESRRQPLSFSNLKCKIRDVNVAIGDVCTYHTQSPGFSPGTP